MIMLFADERLLGRLLLADTLQWHRDPSSRERWVRPDDAENPTAPDRQACDKTVEKVPVHV